MRKFIKHLFDNPGAWVNRLEEEIGETPMKIETAGISEKVTRGDVEVMIEEELDKRDQWKKVCEKCGCYVAEPVYGKSEIRTRKVWEEQYGHHLVDREYIHKPVFCKVHAPKQRKKK